MATPKRMRAQAIEWVTGFDGVKEARKKLNSAKTISEIEKIVSGFEPSTAQISKA